MKKSQARVFEEVILFLFGVIIFITFLAFYSSYHSYFISVSEEAQLNQLKDQLASNILKLALKPGNSSIVLKIPKKIGESPYKIQLTNDNITISNRISKSSNLYKISDLLGGTFQGEIWSAQGKVTIIKTENNINLI